MKREIISGIAAVMTLTAMGAGRAPGQEGASGERMSGQRVYTVMVNQANDTVKFNGKLRNLNQNRGLLMELAQGYLGLGTSTILSASKNLVEMGIGMIKEAARDKRPDWQQATLGECRFVKRLPMQTQVLDFYSQPSANGALDPTNMNFSGFGCRQTIEVKDASGRPHEEEVFYVSCSLRDDDRGIARMLNHSKFEVVVDELRFNPYLCNLPNDSLNSDPNTRIDFSFDKRKDLTFNVEAVLSSSWINEAIQVVNNQELGRFMVSASIEPSLLDSDGIFRYDRSVAADSVKRVSVSGESFLVPRSYVGSSDMATASDSWGTGQYKVDMNIYETCGINEEYYTERKKGKRVWRKERWQPEWKMMKKRKRGESFWQTVTTQIVPQFGGKQWLTTVTEPLTSVLLTHEGKLVNTHLALPGSGAAQSGGTQSATPGGQGASAPQGENQNGKGKGGNR